MTFSLTETDARTGFIKSKDQTSLFYRKFGVKNPRASVLVVHGFGEHGGRYTHVFEKLNQAQFEVFNIDFRGHGHSEGKRGDVENFSDFEDDVLAALQQIKKSAAKKIFVLAHSMGALTSLLAVIRDHVDIDGMVMSCPLLAFKLRLPWWKKTGSKMILNIFPTLRVSSTVKGDLLSSDKTMATAYDQDPLVLQSLSIRSFWAMQEATEQALAIDHALPFPFLMQVGENDPVVDPNVAIRFFYRLEPLQRDATLKIYGNFLHEIYNEAQRNLAIDDAISWLKDRS